MTTPILLLKSPSPTPAKDPYTTYLSSSFQPHFVPVLSHTLLPDALIKLLLTYLDPHSQRFSHPFPYGALILTSQRSAAALNAALSSPILQQKVGKEKLQGLKVRLYVVGPATERAVREVVGNWLGGCEIFGGERAGSGEELAKMMLGLKEGKGVYDIDEEVSIENGHDQGSVETRKRWRKPVLFLVGETRRDIIPKMLQSMELSEESRIKVNEIVVYQSSELQEFAFEFERTLARTAPSSEGVRWTIVFSPTGGAGMLKGFGWCDEKTGRIEKSKMNGRKDFVCCIGPTTKAYLEREFDFRTDVVAETPSPMGVRNGIENYVTKCQLNFQG